MPEPADWFEAVGLALTGERLDGSGVAPDAEVSASGVAAWLHDLGWTPDRLQEHRASRQLRGEPWPHPLPAGTPGTGMAAQLQSLLAGVRQATGTSGLVSTVRPAHPHLGPGADRLLGEVPPHHGNV